MQTFMPYEDFEQSAQVLDNRRLGKQRIEALECLYLVTGLPLHTLFPKYTNMKNLSGSATPTPNERTMHWNHPCHIMWNGYPAYLANYGMTICLEWQDRGFVDNQLPKFMEVISMLGLGPEGSKWEKPPWMGDPRLHDSHKANLVRKLPSLYSEDWPDIEPADIYYWPRGKEIT